MDGQPVIFSFSIQDQSNDVNLWLRFLTPDSFLALNNASKNTTSCKEASKGLHNEEWKTVKGHEQKGKK